MRAIAAETLYNAILMDDSIVEDVAEDEEAADEVQVILATIIIHAEIWCLCQEILLESPWESDVSKFSEQHSRLCELLGVESAA